MGSAPCGPSDGNGRLGLRLPLAIGAVLSIEFLALTLTRRRAIAAALESSSAAVGGDGSTDFRQSA